MAKRATNLLGKTCGDWTVLERVEGQDTHNAYWKCKCKCGNISILPTVRLSSNKVRGCRTCGKSGPRTHGMSQHPLYSTWRNIIDRCYNTDSKSYSAYGGRGIKIADQWKENVQLFIHDIESVIGAKPGPLYSLDRIDNNSNYVLENLRWATWDTQFINTRFVNKLDGSAINDIRYNSSKSVEELSREYNIGKEMIGAIVAFTSYEHVPGSLARALASHYERLNMVN